MITPEIGTRAEGEGQLQRDGNRNRGMDRVTGRSTHIGTETEGQRDWDRDRTITDRKERGQRDRDRRTGKREIHRHKDWDWDIDRRTGTEGRKS